MVDEPNLVELAPGDGLLRQALGGEGVDLDRDRVDQLAAGVVGWRQVGDGAGDRAVQGGGDEAPGLGDHLAAHHPLPGAHQRLAGGAGVLAEQDLVAVDERHPCHLQVLGALLVPQGIDAVTEAPVAQAADEGLDHRRPSGAPGRGLPRASSSSRPRTRWAVSRWRVVRRPAICAS